MDETINKETVAGESGAAETPSQQPSETQAAPSAVDEESLKGILEPLVQAEVEKRTQSIKDKRIAKQESRISGLEDTLAQLKELKDEGLSEKFAIQFLEMREQLGGRSEVPAEVPPEQESAVQATVAPDAILSSVLNIAGLDSGDADVVEIIRSNPNDASAQVLAVNKLMESRKQAQQTPANAAATMPSGGGSALEPNELETITKELTEVLTLPSTPENRQRIQELGKKQREFIPKE